MTDQARSREARHPNESADPGYPTDRIHGVIPVLEALRAGRRTFEHIAIAEGARHERLREILELAKSTNVPVRRVPRLDIDRSAGNATHQGVMARIASAVYADAFELLANLAAQVTTDQQPLALGLDGLEDPRNFGAVLRTAECAGVQAVFTTERRAVGLTETVAKAAAGALEYIRVARVPNLSRLIEQLKERNIWIVGTAADAPREYTDWDWTLPTAVFVGSEGAGLHRLVRERCDVLVRIPTVGHLESLNVSVATGIVLYEALRQRRIPKGTA
ncbi:MAG TPA: 23S rRNA (guanosine(2251)-2'-O)-methyltransferase RlmB [Pyrinomonadaceae bacterium]|nr:23S rRNA (guanosine(2251)-2'-O)-methyltransferase RlmB [Pyrinomonadaceae bacterium]